MSFRRQRPILPEPARNLIAHVTGFNVTDMHFESCSNYVATQLYDVAGIGGNRNKSIDHTVINQRIEGLADKLSMKNQDSKAEALKDYLGQLRGLANAVGDSKQSRSVSAVTNSMDQEEASQNVVSSVLLMLLELSESPTVQPKGVYGYLMPDHLRRDQGTPKTEEQINKEMWQAILKEDPFIGDHWAQREVDDKDSDDSDFEDMDVDERAVPSVISEEQQGNLHDDFYNDSQGTSSLDFWTATSTPSKSLRKDQTKMLKVLKQQQYWKDQELVPKNVSTTQRSEETPFDLQDATLLSRMLRDSRDDFGEVIPLEEVDIIHEVFLLLLGLPTTIFIAKADSRPMLEPTVTLSHLSQGALLSILQPFTKSAFIVSSLQSEVDRICSAPTSQHGKVIQAFASAVHSELQELKTQMSNLQQTYQKYRTSTEQRVASLIELQSTLQPFMRTASTLFDFWKQCPFSGSLSTQEQTCAFSIQLLSQLYDNITQTTLYGNSSNSALFNRILQQCMIPFLNNMESWLSGQPLDSDSESMIKLSQDVEQLSNEFWSHGVQYQTRMIDGDGDDGGNGSLAIETVCPSFLTKESLRWLMYAGKAIRIIGTLVPVESLPPPASGFSSAVMSRIIGVGDDKQSQFGYAPPPTARQRRHYSQVSSLQYPLSTPPSGFHGLSMAGPHREMNTEADLCGIDFESRVEIELQRAIEGQYAQTNVLLKSVLFTQSRLMWHLQGMAEFYFMLQGGAMHWFSTAMFSKIQRRRPWCDNYILGSTFNQVAMECNWPFKQFVKIRVKDQENTKSKLGGYSLVGLRISMLEQVEFEYL
ncbi:Gamma-tubulin complex component 5, partial [Podila clonocystis]